MRNSCRRDGSTSRIAGLYKVLTGRPSGKGNRYAEKIQTEEILLRRLFGGGYLPPIYQSKGEGEAVQADNRDSAAAQSAARRGQAAPSAPHQFHGCGLFAYISAGIKVSSKWIITPASAKAFCKGSMATVVMAQPASNACDTAIPAACPVRIAEGITRVISQA